MSNIEYQTFDRFEYKQVIIDDYQLMRILNELGNDGWELINISKTAVGNTNYLFKRKIICYAETE